MTRISYYLSLLGFSRNMKGGYCQVDINGLFSANTHYVNVIVYDKKHKAMR